MHTDRFLGKIECMDPLRLLPYKNLSPSQHYYRCHICFHRLWAGEGCMSVSRDWLAGRRQGNGKTTELPSPSLFPYLHPQLLNSFPSSQAFKVRGEERGEE